MTRPAERTGKRREAPRIPGTLVVGAVLVALVVVAAAISLVWTPFDPTVVDPSARLLPPNSSHWLGTDDFGRDIVSILLVGARTTLLVGVLRRLGLSPRYVVPRRLAEGYGLTRTAIDRALEGGQPDLFIALDCGTNSHDEVAHLRAQGIDVIVVDHHRSKDEPLVDAILINPHVHEVANDHAWRHLCTVGLTFKLLHGLLKKLRLENYPGALDIKLKDYLDLVAMAPDRTFAACCLFWLDEENAVGQIEPVGTHPDYRRRGLGRALIEEGLRRLRALGATTAYVRPEDPRPDLLQSYESCGFRVSRKDHIYFRSA